MEVHIKMSEVKFLDYFKMNISEGILQVRACQSRTKVGGSKTIRYRVVSTVNYADYEFDIVLRGICLQRVRKGPAASDDFSSALQEIKSFWVPGGV